MHNQFFTVWLSIFYESFFFFKIQRVIKNAKIAENNPAGNPMKIEKNICVERSSVTSIVTKARVTVKRNIEMVNTLLLFI